MNLITAFLRYYFSPTLANWRALRRVCMKRLPKGKPAAPPAEVMQRMAQK